MNGPLWSVYVCTHPGGVNEYCITTFSLQSDTCSHYSSALKFHLSSNNPWLSVVFNSDSLTAVDCNGYDRVIHNTYTCMVYAEACFVVCALDETTTQNDTLVTRTQVILRTDGHHNMVYKVSTTIGVLCNITMSTLRHLFPLLNTLMH